MVAGVFNKIDVFKRTTQVHFKQRKNRKQTEICFPSPQLQSFQLIPWPKRSSAESNDAWVHHRASALPCSAAALTPREQGPDSISSPGLSSQWAGEQGQQHPAGSRTRLQGGRSSSTGRRAQGGGKGKDISNYFTWRLATEADGHRSSRLLQSHAPYLFQHWWACPS